MKIKILIAALLLTALLLTGCTENTIRCGVDADNNAYLHYDIVLDMSEVDAADRLMIRIGLGNLSSYYRDELGFETEEIDDDDNDTMELRMTYSVENESFDEAMAALKTLLSDETRVPFSGAAVDCVRGDMVQSGAVTVVLEADRVLATAGIAGFPAGQAKLMKKAFSECTLTLELSLPATELPAGENAEISEGLALKQTRVSFDSPTELSLKTIISATGATPARDLLEQTERDATVMKIIAIVLGTAAVGFLSAMIIMLLRRRKKERIPEDPPME